MIFQKKIVQDVVEPIFKSEDDRRYHDLYPGRWQGEVEKIGENISYVCVFCNNSREHISRIKEFYKEEE
jgi:hypothetical protein